MIRHWATYCSLALFGVGCYFYLMFISPWGLLVLQASVFLTVAAVLVIIAWIGYLMATEV